MGKAEQFKLERRLQQSQHAVEDKIKQEKRMSFLYGVGCGIAIMAVVGGIVFATRKPERASTLSAATESGKLAPITVPSNLQLESAAPTPLLQ